MKESESSAGATVAALDVGVDQTLPSQRNSRQARRCDNSWAPQISGSKSTSKSLSSCQTQQTLSGHISPFQQQGDEGLRVWLLLSVVFAFGTMSFVKAAEVLRDAHCVRRV